MDIAGKARMLERRITRTVDAAVTELIGGSEPAPLEVVHEVLDRAEQHIQDIGRGRRVFPFNRIVLHVVAPPAEKEKRARFAAVVEGPPSLCDRLTERLRSAGCPVTGLTADIVYARQRAAGWGRDFHVAFERVARAPEALPAPPETPAGEVKRIKLAVIKGAADQRAYAFSGGRIDIGRRAEVIDKRQNLVRTNHVAFSEDGAEVNGSVSRRHAHIELGSDRQTYRIWDDKSAHGTSIIRNGRTVKVPPGARGTRLEPGDEIVLGHARLRVTFDSKKSGT